MLFFHQEKRPVGSNGLAPTLYSLEFSIAKDGTEYLASTSVDVDNDVLGVSANTYFATFETDDADDVGDYLITWTFQVTTESDPETATSKFTLVDPAYPLVDGYAQVADMLAEGVPVGDETGEIAASVVATKLAEASRYIERFCRQQFRPHFEEVSLDTRGKQKLIFEEPVIGLLDLSYEDGDALISMDDYTYRVYNRHIRQGMVNPDDRNTPRVELTKCSRFARFLPQQVFVDGFFGYTDPDGTIWGCTPAAIKECTMRLALRSIAPLYDPTTGGSSPQTSGPIQGEKTYDQSVTYANIIFAREGMGTAYVGYITGDPRIDQVLFQFKRPIALGTVGGY